MGRVEYLISKYGKEGKEYLEEWYSVEDPWEYKKNDDDYKRRDIISDFIRKYGDFDSILDIGCGEGFVTCKLPAKEVWGYDLSNNATKRLPDNVHKFSLENRKFDIVCCMGLIYRHYDWKGIIKMAQKYSNKYVFTSHLIDVEHPNINDIGKLLETKTFDYRGSKQIIRMYELSIS